VHGHPIKATAALLKVFIKYSTANRHAANDGEEIKYKIFVEQLLKYLDVGMTTTEISKRIEKDVKGSQVCVISNF
jgi:hypothetical protein